MNNIKLNCSILAVILLFSSSLIAQTVNPPPVSKLFAVLPKALESKTATKGQEFVLRTISDVLVNGEVVIPRGSKVLGHVSSVATKGKDEPESRLALIIDKAINARGVEIPLQAIVAAVARPTNSLSSDPTYGMMHSNEPKMIGTSPGGNASAGGLSSSSKAAGTAAVATANINGGTIDEASLLNDDSQGAVGYEGLSLSWQLIAPPPITVFAGKGKNLKLEAGTQMLLRLATPKLPG